jgi:DMSO/TMAO reductase YedYZ molybdopterin-dependent catalytic subunit
MAPVRARRDDVNRRTFLRLAAAGLSSAFAPLGALTAAASAAAAGTSTGACSAMLSQQRGTFTLPTPDAPYTRVEDWYYVSFVDAFTADLEKYRLKIAGIVDNGLSFSVPELRTRFENVTEPITLACVGNPPQGQLLSAAFFRGVRVRDVLALAAPSARAEAAIITGLDGFVSVQSMKELMRSESLFAFDMADVSDAVKPLTVEHGFPLRILTPGLYGYMQPKWIDTVTIVDDRGYQDVLRGSIEYARGHMQLATGFSRPQPGQHLVLRTQEILGYAYGDGRPIAKVDIRIDGGDWRPAPIVFNKPFGDLPPFVWALWRYVWKDITLGSHSLESRATYTDGETQIEGHRFPYSGGSVPRIDIVVVPSS